MQFLRAGKASTLKAPASWWRATGAQRLRFCTAAPPALNDGGAVLPGQFAFSRRTFSIDDVRDFARVSGDHNPIHVDAAAAQAAGFDGPICHGILYSSLIGTLFASQVPGVLYVSQELKFLAPVYVEEEVEVEIEVLDVRKRFCSFQARIFKGAEGAARVKVLDGEGQVRLPR